VFDGLAFRVAAGEERTRALELQHQVYAEDLGHVPEDSFDARAHFLVACADNGGVVAVFRLVGPEQRPFDLEAFVNVKEILAPGRIPALVGRLCIRRDHRNISKHMFLQIGLFKLAYAFAEKRGITDLLLYTYPKLIAFYRGALFNLVNRTFEHPDWGTVHLMHLDLLGLEARCAQSRNRLARLLFATDVPNLVV
jgi:hypothetical protein